MENAKIATNAIVGGWSTYKTDISKQEMQVFNEAVKLVGVTYTPFAVATQVVSGVNYRFLCNAKGLYQEAPNQLALIQIYKPLNGKPHVTSLKIIE